MEKGIFLKKWFHPIVYLCSNIKFAKCDEVAYGPYILDCIEVNQILSYVREILLIYLHFT